MKNRERGGALPAALVLQLILLLVGLEVALAAAVLRLAVARTGARVQAVRLAEGAVALAAGEPGSVLLAALEGDGELAIDLAPMQPAMAIPPVKVLDDQDGDGDPHQDGNGRILLQAQAEVSPFPATEPSRASLVREVLIGHRLPLPAALVDCGGGLEICAGEDGCAVPQARVTAVVGAALAVPDSRLEGVGRALFTLSREVLRAARLGCESSVCSDQDDRLLRAAATQILRRLGDAGSDAAGLTLPEVGRLVDGLLALAGDESGSGSFPWWDGSWRAVADLSVLPAAVNALALTAEHIPSLAEHPYPQVFQGPHELVGGGGVCGRLPVYLENAVRGGLEQQAGAVQAAPEQAVTILALPRRVESDEILAGQGLLVLRETLTVAAGGRLEWRGSVVMDGGRLAGGGSMVIQGSLLIMPRPDPGRLPLATSLLHLELDAAAHAAAWTAAGNILLSVWPGPAGP